MDRRSSSVDDQVAELTRRLTPEATAIKTARSLAELRSEPNEERTAFSTCYAGALDVMRYNTLNQIRAIPLVARCLVVLRLSGEAISWLFLWVSRAARRCTAAAEQKCSTGMMRKNQIGSRAGLGSKQFGISGTEAHTRRQEAREHSRLRGHS